MKIIKRSGDSEPFNKIKITQAIVKALRSCDESKDVEDDAERVTDLVIDELRDEEVHLEKIQDLIEKQLMQSGLTQSAKNYVIFRHERERSRHNLLKDRSGLTKSKELTAFQKKLKENKELSLLVQENSKYFDGDLMRQFVFYRTYSRWLEGKNRREVWSETVDRYMAYMKVSLSKRNTPLSDQVYDEIREAILYQRVMPSMRALQFAGPAVDRCNVCIYNCSYIAPETLNDFAEIMYLAMCGVGTGWTVETKHVCLLPTIKIQDKSRTLRMIQIDDSKEGWCDSLRDGLTEWYAGGDVEFDYSLLRPAGARLKTMGGRSSGPAPLKELHVFVRTMVLDNQGCKLSSTQVYDIICKIGAIVVAGGVRRTANISFSDLNDSGMRDVKNGPFWEKNPQRSLSNNSVAYKTKPSFVQFLDEWNNLARSGTGERGIFNVSGLDKVIPERRIELLGEQVRDLRSNPCCVTADTWISTSSGSRQVSSLIGRNDFKVMVNNEEYELESNGFYSTGVREVFEVETDKGYKVRATSYHPFLTDKGMIEVKDLKKGDTVIMDTWDSFDKIKSITQKESEEVYDVTVKDIHRFVANGFILSNSEILLLPKEFCNLSEVVCRPDDTLDSLLDKIRIATIIGTYQSTFDDFKYISKEWRENQVKERLLGVSLTGQFDCSEVREEETLIKLREKATQVNIEYAKLFCINASTSITTTKPSGTVSSMVNSSSGIHPRFAPYYIRRVRIASTDPLLQLFRDSGFKAKPEVGQTEENATTFVLEFPVALPKCEVRSDYAVIFTDIGVMTSFKGEFCDLEVVDKLTSKVMGKRYDAVRIADKLFVTDSGLVTVDDIDCKTQLENWLKVKKAYIDHSISVTLYLEDDEWMDIGSLIYSEFDNITGISFLPKSNHIYELAPYEKISKEKYDELIKNQPEINFSKLIYYEKQDSTTRESTAACAGGMCDLA